MAAHMPSSAHFFSSGAEEIYFELDVFFGLRMHHLQKLSRSWKVLHLMQGLVQQKKAAVHTRNRGSMNGSRPQSCIRKLRSVSEGS